MKVYERAQFKGTTWNGCLSPPPKLGFGSVDKRKQNNRMSLWYHLFKYVVYFLGMFNWTFNFVLLRKNPYRKVEGGRGETTRTLVPWRRGCNRPIRNQRMDWFVLLSQKVHTIFSHNAHIVSLILGAGNIQFSNSTPRAIRLAGGATQAKCSQANAIPLFISITMFSGTNTFHKIWHIFIWNVRNI